MKLSEDYSIGTNVIRSFTNQAIEVNNRTYNSSLIVSNTLLIPDWEVNDIQQMSHENWQELTKHKPELIIIGTGNSIVFPHPSSYAPAIEQGIGVEFMDSAAACRTYNVLVAEDRFVIAGIIL